MKYYYAHLQYSTALRNNLENEFHELLIGENGKLIPRTVFNYSYQSELIEKVNQLNTKHKRCKPLELYFTRLNMDNAISLHSGTGIHFQFLLSKELS